MIYAKNVPVIERAVRVLIGVALVAFGLLGMKGNWIGYALAASGAVAVMTGFIGFCPMCALAGRRIQQTLDKRHGDKIP